jgi:hypothetical protein
MFCKLSYEGNRVSRKGQRRRQRTVVIPVRAGRIRELKTELAVVARTLDRMHRDQAECPLCIVPGLQFFRCVLLPEQAIDGRAFQPPSLVLWVVVDHEVKRPLQALCDGPFAPVLGSILAFCEGYSPDGDTNRMAAYLRSWATQSKAAYFDGLRGWTRAIMEDEEQLRAQMAAYLDAAREHPVGDPVHLWLEARAWVRANENFERLFGAPVRRCIRPNTTNDGWFARCVAWLLDVLLRRFLGEAKIPTQQPKQPQVSPAELAASSARTVLVERERLGVNRATILSDIQDKRRSRLVVRATLWFLRILPLRMNSDGRLIGIGTIHCAEWLLIDRHRRLLFFTNYDGTWEDYFDDFSSHAATALNAIWGTSCGFPPTYGLRVGGAFYPRDFRASARVHQVPTQVWHMPSTRLLSLERIRVNACIRDGITQPQTPAQIREWFGLFARARGV